MHATKSASLHETVRDRGGLDGRSVFAAETTVAWSEFLTTSVLDGRGDELRGRTVLLATKDQLTTLRALIELDGIAARIVLYPPDLSLEHLCYVVEAAGTDVLVSDRMRVGQYVPRVRYYVPCCEKISPLEYERGPQLRTEWVLLTSGTTGPPKLVAHTLASLTGAIATDSMAPERMVWSTFYDIRRYGGLQILLRAAFTGASLVLSSADEATGDFLGRAADHKVSHISGTPSHWRRALMSPSAHRIDPEYVRLSGEIADQGILNQLRSTYPQARVAHAFASTEAGLAFDVDDGATGFPASAIGETPGVEMKVVYGSLRIRSGRTASCYLGEDAPALMDAEGFVDTCDLLELHDGRYHFVGRRDGMINVGGMKVHPEEVEAVINRHPGVQMSLVRAKKNPITGSLVVADVVLRGAPENSKERVHELQDDILHFCRQTLSSHKVPAAINVVATLTVAESGKLVRHFA